MDVTSATRSSRTAASRSLVVHFDEVALKGGRRRYFVRKLVRNIRRALGPWGDTTVRSLYDRIVVGPIDDDALVAAQSAVAVLPGVSWFSVVKRRPVAVESLEQIADDFSSDGTEQSFAVRARRSKKDFPLKSNDINRELGAMIQARTGWSVDLTNPGVAVHLDVTPHGIFTYFEKNPGPGGLPVGSTGKLVCLLSGGLDSPVAAYKMMCRGCRVAFVHFHNAGPQAHGVRRKLVQILEQLSRYQASSRLYLVPFAQVQSDLIATVPPRKRMVAYRRAMLRLAGPIVRAEQAGGLIVGDSVGQVASQTLENLHATYTATEHPVLAPLIGESKRATMNLARQIGTYEPSILPYEDCCQLLVSKSPDVSCDRAQMESHEQQIALDDYCSRVIEESEILEIPPPAPTTAAQSV